MRSPRCFLNDYDYNGNGIRTGTIRIPRCLAVSMRHRLIFYGRLTDGIDFTNVCVCVCVYVCIWFVCGTWYRVVQTTEIDERLTSATRNCAYEQP